MVCAAQDYRFDTVAIALRIVPIPRSNRIFVPRA
jgi:hypothetical protein